MPYDWSSLRQPPPATLVGAREAAHAAAQAVTKAARANLPAAPDDSHSALYWQTHNGRDAFPGTLVTAPLPRRVKVGLDVANLEYVFFSELGWERGASETWLDGRLKAAGLAPGSGVKLPYAGEVPKARGKAAGLDALARWFAAAADALEEVRTKHNALAPSPAYLWPHHFDLATLLTVTKEKSIGVGISMGDHYYAQPYAYVSPYPAPKGASRPALPAGGHWHTKDFFGAAATADELLAQKEPRAALLAVIEAALKTFLD